ncbi:MAG TPA: 1-deoxy-D-xylulose-5-phosphate reductoisomerase [Candidatus Hydrogenedentes bacterium]|nr:1-deoxy-D-xylulose-5-phosphate reductoisomerase [Candidatus Hydrogenedentota bacterium]HRT18751.1 1-deoxy-D-xylulose-5-phosphate reductoisomerase [Candidatus Hydrogenedentota bacterium]HRT63771.1 1-deoxy-D-xylulose-5-phosphate reductoisomerase [Candidatus Hydrogenedentota bacterium]
MANAAPLRVSILGSTGSIGRSALDVVRQYPDRFEVIGLAAHANMALLARQIAEFRPAYAAITGPHAADFDCPSGVEMQIGPQALSWLASIPADVAVCSVVGAAGLRPALAAIDAGSRLALANKEPMVMAGRLIMARAEKCGVPVIPVDSEHNAIFQCLAGHRAEDVRCVHLTASGGPFYGRPRETLRGVTPEEATRHPTWDMGAKISVDSATLMNKGLEVIEAMHLFRLPRSKIEVIIHPQSVVHSLVEFCDGSILGHFGVTDMRLPIAFALAWPERVECPVGRLDLAAVRELTFAAPDVAAFPCLGMALDAAAEGGTAPAILNAANEVAVEAFCQGHIAFLDIEEVVRRVLNASVFEPDTDLETVEQADARAREAARRVAANIGNMRNSHAVV